MNINEFSKEVHQNAVDHGFWEEKHSFGEITAFIHSEWSEALEEYRANRPMIWYRCGHIAADKICDYGYGNGGCDLYCTDDCKRLRGKPEGIAVELIDGCLRILNFFGEIKAELPLWRTLAELMDGVKPGHVPDDLPDLIALLHSLTSLAYSPRTNDSMNRRVLRLYEALGIACAWVKMQGLDPETLMLEKHEYNKTRPYKHGKKC